MLPPDGSAINPGGLTHNVHVIPARAKGCLDDGTFAAFDWAENHSPIGYALMLDGANPEALRLRP